MPNPEKCQRIETYFKTIRSTGLENELRRIIDIIRTLHKGLISPFKLSSRFIYKNIQGIKRRILLNSENRIIELTFKELKWNIPTIPLGVRGGHSSGLILLHKNYWCKQALIHETLHTFQNVDLSTTAELLAIKEGLTEFLTGACLYKDCKHCYNDWKQGTYNICSITYEPWVKIFGAFCNFLPFSLITNLYFHDGKSWNEKYQIFLDEIHKKGYPKFNDIFKIKKKIPLQLRLLQECYNNFGKREFQNIYLSRDKSLDFNKILK